MLGYVGIVWEFFFYVVEYGGVCEAVVDYRYIDYRLLRFRGCRFFFMSFLVYICN